MVTVSIAARLAPALLLLLLAGGCASLSTLREGRYEEVTPEQIHRAGESEDSRLAAPLKGLLENRLDAGGTEVPGDKAIEAVIALGKVGSSEDAPIVLRLLREDSSGDVRYFAVDALAMLDRAALVNNAKQLLGSEENPLVRSRLRELLVE